MKNPTRRTPTLLVLGALALAGLVVPARAQAKGPIPDTLSLSFGVYQTDKATVMYRAFTPILEAIQDDMAAKLDRPVDIQLTIFKSYTDGIQALVDGKVDIVHFGPASYITAKLKNPGVQLVAMEHEKGEKRFKGMIIVKKDSPIQSIGDLRGKRFAFGDKNSTIGRYLVQAELVDHGILASDLSDFRYMERHDQVAGAVELGDFDAGSIKSSTYAKYKDKGTLRKLAEFENVTKPIVARAGLDRSTFDALQAAFFGLKDEAALKELKISGFMATSDDEYDFVRQGMKKAERFDPAVGN